MDRRIVKHWGFREEVELLGISEEITFLSLYLDDHKPKSSNCVSEEYDLNSEKQDFEGVDYNHLA
jgi:hypothetical protein